MAGIIWEIKGSGDFSGGPGQLDGKGKATVVEAADQDEAYQLARAFFPLLVGRIPRGKIDVKDQGNGVFAVEVDYQPRIPGEGQTGAGQTPQKARPNPKNDQPLSRDISFSMGGGTQHVTRNPTGITRYKLAKDGDTAADFKGLIGVDYQTGDVKGCDILAATADFTITKRFEQLTIGWFRTNLDRVATTNDASFLGTDQGECLYKGADGQYKDGDENPWTVTGRWSYSRNRTAGEEDPDPLLIGEIQIPDLRGHEYVWTADVRADQTVTVGGKPVTFPIAVPRWVYVEQVYFESDHEELGFN